MSLEKRGVIDENTPYCGDGCGDGSGCCGEPDTKEAADKIQSHPANDMTDAVADQTDLNRR